MQINFFEEFPSEKTLSISRKITFPSTIFLAAKSVDRYLCFCKLLHRYNPTLKTVYWPILKGSYWLSRLALPEEIDALIREISHYPNKKTFKLMLDLELPIINPVVFLLSIRNFSRSRKSFKQLFSTIKELKITSYTAEYPLPFFGLKMLWQCLGLFPSQSEFRHTQIPMVYSSFLHGAGSLLSAKMFRKISQSINQGDQIYIGLGTIAHGILGNEPILTPLALDHNLRDLEEIGIKNVVIFRLGGLNNEYLTVVKKYLD